MEKLETSHNLFGNTGRMFMVPNVTVSKGCLLYTSNSLKLVLKLRETTNNNLLPSVKMKRFIIVHMLSAFSADSRKGTVITKIIQKVRRA